MIVVSWLVLPIPGERMRICQPSHFCHSRTISENDFMFSVLKTVNCSAVFVESA